MLGCPSTLGAINPPNAVNTLIALSGTILLLLWTVLWRFHHLCWLVQNHPKGCRRLGLSPKQSNLHDEYDSKYSQDLPEKSTDANGLPSWRVKALFAYPIKSCAGVELDVADVVPTGLALDRQFCFAEAITSSAQQQSPQNDKNSSTWTARTLRDRDFNRMALIRPEIWIPDPTRADYSLDLDEVKSQGVLVIHYPNVGHGRLQSCFINIGIALGLLSPEESFHVPLFPSPDSITTYPTLPVKIWKDSPQSYDYGHHLPPSLRKYLSSSSSSFSSSSSSSSTKPQHPLTLFRVNPSHHRQIFRCAPPKETLGFQTVTGFADAYPLHILNLASVQDVAARCAADITRLSVRRFRANIIIQGPAAFAEDDWKRILVRPSPFSDDADGDDDSTDNGVVIYTVCRTVRCRLPNVDPDTGVRHRSEPDRTLKRYRKIDRGDPTNACLGMQAVAAVEKFQIRVGDAISVLETGEHFYIKMLAPGEKIPGE